MDRLKTYEVPNILTTGCNPESVDKIELEIMEQKSSHSEADDKDNEREPDRKSSSASTENITIENEKASLNERNSSTFKTTENHSPKSTGNILQII